MKKNYPLVIVSIIMLYLAECGAALVLLAMFNCPFDITFSWQHILGFGLVFLGFQLISCLLHKE